MQGEIFKDSCWSYLLDDEHAIQDRNAKLKHIPQASFLGRPEQFSRRRRATLRRGVNFQNAANVTVFGHPVICSDSDLTPSSYFQLIAAASMLPFRLNDTKVTQSLHLLAGLVSIRSQSQGRTGHGRITTTLSTSSAPVTKMQRRIRIKPPINEPKNMNKPKSQPLGSSSPH